MPIPIAILQRLRLFDTLPATLLAEIAPSLSERRVERRELVIKRGQADAGLGFLLEGRLQTVDFTLDGREVGLEFIDVGDYFGELSVIDGQPAAEYVVAVAPSRVVVLDRDRARRLMFSSPQAAAAVSLRLAARLRRAAQQRALLALPSSFQRICAQLVLLTSRGDDGSWVIMAPPTHQEIAVMANTSRESVTRALQFLQGLKVIARTSDRLVVQQPDALRQAADGKIAPAR